MTIRLDSGRDGIYARAVTMESLLPCSKSAASRLRRRSCPTLFVDVLSLGVPRVGRWRSTGCAEASCRGAFVTIGDGRMRLRMKLDDNLSVRPLLQPAIEQLDPNESIAIFLDARGHVIDMVRTAKR